MDKAKNIILGIIGSGTVGQGTLEILKSQKEKIEHTLNTKLIVRYVCSPNIESKDEECFSIVENKITNANILLDDPEVDIVIEAAGGVDFSKDYVLRALKNKKQVVTANKALLAEYRKLMFDTARENKVNIYYEASVGGGIPVITTALNYLNSDNVIKIKGILNGTANYILTKMSEENLRFDEALQIAFELGYSEADPSFDVDGIDTAHKIVILASILFNANIKFSEISIGGIRNIKPIDFTFAKDLEVSLKLLASARMIDNKLDIRIEPTFLSKNSILSSVNDVFNGVLLTCKYTGNLLLSGRGAGGFPTGAAIVSDIISAGKSLQTDFSELSKNGNAKDYELLELERVVSAYYLRFTVEDIPGVLSKITGVLGNNDISIGSAIQKNSQNNEIVPLVVVTHKTSRYKMDKALKEINSFSFVKEDTVCIPVEGVE